MRLVLALVLFGLAAPSVLAQEFGPFPRMASPEARAQAYAAGFRASAAPPAPVRAIAEFERSEAVVVSYSSWVTPNTKLPLELIRLLSEHVTVISLHSTDSKKAQVESAYVGAGVNMDNVEFFKTPTNSIWTRDYGPFYIADGDRNIGIVDFIYDVASRPLDNTAPAALANYFDVPIYTMDLTHVGGNYMVTGYGSAASTDRLLSFNPSEAVVRQQAEAYLGIDDYLIFPDPQNTYIDHIDTWAKFLDVDKVLVAQADPGHPDYAALEAIADELAETPSPWGWPYEVVRIYAPDRQPYTNSLIVNDRVYVATGEPGDAALDAQALQTYRDAMPGYTVHGVDAPYWLSTDALHCRTKEIADMGLLSVRHTPVPERVRATRSLTVDAEIIAYSGAELLEDDLHLIYRTGDAPFDTLALERVGPDDFRARFPALRPGTEVEYYLSASDASGRTEHFPLVGPEGPRTFRVVGRTPPAAAATANAEAGVAELSLDASPNPARGAMTLRYGVAEAGPVTLEVFDAMGRRVASLWDGTAEAGEHRATWDTSALPAGVYLARLTSASGAVEMQRVTVVR